MTEIRELATSATSLSSLIARARDETDSLVEAIVSEIQEEIPSYSGPAVGERHRLITTAVTAAITQFFDLLEDEEADDPKVDELFRQIGFGEATDERGVESLRAVLRIARRRSWARVRGLVIEHELSSPAIVHLTDALFGYFDHLERQATQGHEWAIHDTSSVPAIARAHLLEALLDPAPASDARQAELATHADNAQWTLPEKVVVMRVTFHGEFPEVTLPSDPLSDLTTSPGTVVCDNEHASQLARSISRAVPGVRVAVSWPVAPEHASDGDRWASRAIALVDKGVLPPQPIVNCPDHAVHLWLHGEPMLRQRLARDLLKPLLAETPNSREILSETMLAWLESRDSAPAIASKLGVHPQTVRYRWKRINELFGTQLHDAEFVITVTMVLKATVPLWKAGDQGDIEHYRANSGPS